MRATRIVRCYLFLVAAGLTGCGVSSPRTAAATHIVSLAGKVHGGQQPVSGATIQLYTPGTTGDGSSSTSILNATVMTAADGSFSLTSEYNCPSSNPDVYVTAVGGNPGLGTNGNNPSLALMAALGPCDSLAANTFISINEVTTVGSLAALYPYASGVGAIGSAAGDASQLNAAFGAVAEYTNTATGSAPGPNLAAGYYASSTEINTLADVLSTCINSGGGVANDGSDCGRLFEQTKSSAGVAPTDTVQAVINILNNPTQNVAAIFNLQPSTGAPFQPTLSGPPTDWTLPILPIPATPTFSEPAGTYVGSQSIGLGETTAGATIYYTLDGSTPTTASAVYSGPIAVSSPETIEAVASVEGRTFSAVASADYLVAPAGTAPAETSATPSSSGTPISVVTFGNDAFVSVQGSGQIFTYDITTGYPLQYGKPYTMPCQDPSGMVIANIGGVNVMAVVCYDTSSLVTLTVGANGALSALGSVGGLPSPYPGIALVGTNVYVPLFGTSQTVNGGVARVSIATPSAPAVTATVSLASPAAGEFANPGYLTEANGYLYLAAGSESAPATTSSTIQVVNESTMTLVGSPFVLAHSPQQLTVSGTVLYVTVYDATEVESIDASNPASLAALEVLTLSSPACAAIPVLVSGSTGYVGCYAENNLIQLNVSSPQMMTVTSTLSGITAPQAIALSGKYLLVPSGESGGALYQIDTTRAF
jgi:hypothetical protein